MRAVLCYTSTYDIIFITYVLKIKHKLYIASCEPPTPLQYKLLSAHLKRGKRNLYNGSLFLAYKNTFTTLHTHDVVAESSSFRNVSLCSVVCVFRRRKKSFYLLMMCYRLLYCQEIPWCSYIMRDIGKLTDIGKYYFVNRTIQHWNQLPAEVLGVLPCKSITFRKRVRKVIIELN